MADRILIKDAIVLSQDDSIGELPRADILVEGDRIAEVRPDIAADGARVIDAAGDIVIPGFIDTHRHTWETSIRTCAPDYTLGAYFGAILDKFAPNYRPDDVYAANQWGALEDINAGITTLVDWSHIMNTPEHADAAVQGCATRASGRCSRTDSRTRRSPTGGSAARSPARPRMPAGSDGSSPTTA